MWAQSKNAAYEAYIAEYRQVAIEQQRKHGIPASITMAQALLESAAGHGDSDFFFFCRKSFTFNLWL